MGRRLSAALAARQDRPFDAWRELHGLVLVEGLRQGGIVTWETQQTDYPRTRPDMPNHEPRGCSRGASYSWYLYSANRVKHPMVRSALVKLWRERRRTLAPVDAWLDRRGRRARRAYQSRRGLGGFVRASWDEVNEIVAAANVYTVKRHGPDRVVGFSPIPAMSMVSYAAARAICR
jgi:nitrate reductase alpha subunit